jgi:hypothetical protein
MQNCLNLARIRFGALLTNDMAQKCNAFCNKTTLVWVQFEVYFLEFVHHYTQVLQMLLPAFAVHIEVINEYLQELLPKSLKTSDIVLVNVLVAFLRPNGPALPCPALALRCLS